MLLGTIATVHSTPPSAGVRTLGQRLRFAGSFPTRRGNFFQHRIEIVHCQRDVDMTNVARSKIDILPICRREVLQQLDLVAARRFQYRKLELGAFYIGDLFRPFASLMRAVRKFESENVAPECERALEI